MSDQHKLFDDSRRTESWSRFNVVVKPPRKKIGRTRAPAEPPAPKETVTDEQADTYRRAFQAGYYAWACDELEHWRGRLPAEEFERLRVYVDGQKP